MPRTRSSSKKKKVEKKGRRRGIKDPSLLRPRKDEEPKIVNEKPTNRVVIRLLTPKLAYQLLKRNLHNRDFSIDHAADIAELYRAGQWHDYQLIILSKQKDLLDGQHRAAASILANVCVWMRFSLDNDISQYKVIDSDVKRRSVSDVLKMMGFSYYAMLPSIVRLHAAVQKGNVWTSGVKLTDNAVLRRCMRDKTDLEDAARFVNPKVHLRKLYKGRGVNVAAVCYMKFREQYPEEAEEFFTRLDNNNGGDTKDHPIARLLTALDRENPASPFYGGKLDGNVSRATKMILTYHAFILFLKGKSAGKLTVDKAETLPELPDPSELA